MAELERYGRLVDLQRGLRASRALDGIDLPPAAGPRHLSGLNAAMTTAHGEQAYYYSHPDWRALSSIRQQVDGVLERLNEQAEITPQAAIQAAKITTLASSLIARHAAKVGAYLDEWNQGNTPGGRAMRELARTAEDHAARAAGLDTGQPLDTPRLLITHMHRLSKELQRAGSPDQTPGPSFDAPDDPALDSALSARAAADPELEEAAQLMEALSQLGNRIRRAGHRLTLDVRLHGMVETTQLRGLEMISGIARSAMRHYDEQDRSGDGRRNIAAMVFHYAEQRLERMRGSLGAEAQRDFGHYETDPPERYMDALFEESRTTGRALRDKNITPDERTDLQIRFLLAQNEISPGWGTEAVFPPHDFVAGMQADDPVENRLTLAEALRHRVENNLFDRNAQYLNTVADRLSQEVAGPTALTAQALKEDLHPAQIRAVAAHLVEHDTPASPLILSWTAGLDLTHGQAERALAVLEDMGVVGPTNGLETRETLTVSSHQLAGQLQLLEQRLPNLPQPQAGDAAPSASNSPAGPAPTAPSETAQSPAAAETLQAGRGPVPARSTSTDAHPTSTLPQLPQRDRSAERRHPGNVRRRPDDATEFTPGPDLAELLESLEGRVQEVSQRIVDGKETRAAAHPAPADVAPLALTQAQRIAQQAQQAAGVSVR
ncbi:hypothetical protein OG458_42075 (plasmid) [Streptomyces sp. NBC_01281]|uniref:hypothetical protein n=1 Tax=Streptomyces sp. NBC_01281 TaxID=2903811 RepID=UPI002E104F19|nr:hypothetical protein OG458_42075 [Streptomyces sp. NBC_01281]